VHPAFYDVDMRVDAHSNSAEVIIAGYGLPGRAAADTLQTYHRSYCIVELNAATVQRCEKSHVPIIEGDCRDPEILRKAGIETAQLFIILIPDEHAALEATDQARRLNPRIQIITRCHYTSTGIEARARGATDVIVAEQVVAAEASRRLGERFLQDAQHPAPAR
jgi:voltage-gated potassium channel Kch